MFVAFAAISLAAALLVIRIECRLGKRCPRPSD